VKDEMWHVIIHAWRCHQFNGWLNFVQHSEQFIMLLVGGDKSTQQRDIEKAIKMASEF